MDNIFLDGNIEMNENNYVNEYNIIDRNTNLVQCEDNQKNLYDINKLIVKDVYRENILLSSKDTDDCKYDNKTLRFNLNSDKAGGIQYKKNVIGFRLNECIFTSPVFNVKEPNNTINTSGTENITIKTGYYNMKELATIINEQSENITTSASYTVSYNASYNYKFTIKNNSSSSNSLTFTDTSKESLIYKMGFHFDKENKLDINSSLTANTYPSLCVGTYLDIVVNEIPYKICKQNLNGINIISRIPITKASDSCTIGPVIHYKSDYNINNENLFYPINLSTLTIHLYMDGIELNLENMIISFEFELVILNK